METFPVCPECAKTPCEIREGEEDCGCGYSFEVAGVCWFCLADSYEAYGE